MVKPAPHPLPDEIASLTDVYFNKTKRVVERFGDKAVTYAVFMRRPVVSAPRLAVEWLQSVAVARSTHFDIDLRYREGELVGAGEALFYVSGNLSQLVDLETLFLQQIGASCVAAQNAYAMCADLPKSAFIAFDARHCAGTEMAQLMAYAASVGSARARSQLGAVGFIGNATDATAHFFDQARGFGTMPHALIGYAGSTVHAAEMLHETLPEESLTVLVDYFGKEVTDSLTVCRRFPDLAETGELGIRLDTPGGRYLEGLDLRGSYAVLDRNAPSAVRDYRTESELRHLIGGGVSAAAIWHLREELDKAGFPKVKIIVSSGFGPRKCKIMAAADAPIDVVGTGSFLPIDWHETFATADIVEYDGEPLVKVGREFLLRS